MGNVTFLRVWFLNTVLFCLNKFICRGGWEGIEVWDFRDGECCVCVCIEFEAAYYGNIVPGHWRGILQQS